MRVGRRHAPRAGRVRWARGGLLAVLGALGVGSVCAQEPHIVPLFPAAAATPAAGGGQPAQGFLRVINHSDSDGDVSIAGFDDSGWRSRAVTLELAAHAVAHINSDDFQRGNLAKGLSAGAGSPRQGDWWLELVSDLDIEVNAYVRAADGFLTSVHDPAPESAGLHRIAFFNPGTNNYQQSRLRLINPSDVATEVTIRGVDDAGGNAGPVRATVPARAAYTFTAQHLEGGHERLDGRLGAGSGKWRLTVAANGPLLVLSLLANPTGHIANLSAGVGATESGRRVRHLPLFPAASQPNQGFVRLVNRGAAATVRIVAFDDTGEARGPLTLSLGAGRTAHFNSMDLERGNSSKGLSGGVGAGTGDWRLEVRAQPAAADAPDTAPAVQALAYIRSSEGFVTSMHEVAPVASAHRVMTFNPGSNTLRQSLLRVVNLGAAPATVVVAGKGDDGASGGDVVFVVPADGAKTYSAQALESGGDGLVGALGMGVGKWRLDVTANQPILAMSLLRRPNGPMTNLSTTTRKTAADIFGATVASPIVQGICANCHVAGGAAGGTRLVFFTGDAHNRTARNRRTLERFVQDATDGARTILDKVSGRRGHGGGVQLEAASEEYANMERFLNRLAAQRREDPAPGQTVPPMDAIPRPASDIDPATRHINVIHTADPRPAYSYSHPCPTGVAVRHRLPPITVGERQREVVDHKLECELAPHSSNNIHVQGRGHTGIGIGSALSFTTGGAAAGPAITVRETRSIPRDAVDELLDSYIETALIRDIESRLAQVLVAILIDELARRTWTQLRDPGARYDVVAQSVSYTSRRPNGTPSDAVTGLIAMPDIGAAVDFERKPRVIVLNHATGATPSALSSGDAWFALAGMFAGRGYLVVAPDNWGRGELATPGQPETYLMANRSANNSVDMLTAVLASDDYRAFRDTNAARTDLSVIGYSQGGHTAAALWLALHTGEHGMTVRELFSGAAPHNLLQTFHGAMQHFAGECDGNAWCRHVARDVTQGYIVDRILPGLLAYADIGLASTDLVENDNLRPDFVTGFLAGDAEYQTLRATLALNSFTNLVAPGSAIRGGTEINLYHSKYDRLVPEANTRELATALAEDFDVTYHEDECGNDAYQSLFELVDRVGVLHLICGMEVMDDVLKRFP